MQRAAEAAGAAAEDALQAWTAAPWKSLTGSEHDDLRREVERAEREAVEARRKVTEALDAEAGRLGAGSGAGMPPERLWEELRAAEAAVKGFEAVVSVADPEALGPAEYSALRGTVAQVRRDVQQAHREAAEALVAAGGLVESREELGWGRFFEAETGLFGLERGELPRELGHLVRTVGEGPGLSYAKAEHRVQAEDVRSGPEETDEPDYSSEARHRVSVDPNGEYPARRTEDVEPGVEQLNVLRDVAETMEALEARMQTAGERLAYAVHGLDGLRDRGRAASDQDQWPKPVNESFEEAQKRCAAALGDLNRARNNLKDWREQFVERLIREKEDADIVDVGAYSGPTGLGKVSRNVADSEAALLESATGVDVEPGQQQPGPASSLAITVVLLVAMMRAWKERRQRDEGQEPDSVGSSGASMPLERPGAGPEEEASPSDALREKQRAAEAAEAEAVSALETWMAADWKSLSDTEHNDLRRAAERTQWEAAEARREVLEALDAEFGRPDAGLKEGASPGRAGEERQAADGAARVASQGKGRSASGAVAVERASDSTEPEDRGRHSDRHRREGPGRDSGIGD